MKPRRPRTDALREFVDNLKARPAPLLETAFRTGAPTTDRTRSTFVFGNVFLHLHSVRTHRWSLRWTTTMGLGIMSVAAFLITLVTGVMLMFYYKPYPDVAYESMKDIHFVVPTGRLIRNIHRWAANVMVVAVILHMARAFYTAAYRAPREFNWLIGIGLLVTTLGLSFTGYLLPVGSARLLGDHHRRQHRAIAARGHRRAGHHRILRSGRAAALLLLGSDRWAKRR
jgi:cytochrome b6